MKNKHKHIASILSVFILLSLFNSCGLFTREKKQPEETRSWVGFEKAVIKNHLIDGCTWIMELENEKKLQPVNLTSEFQKDQLKVWVKYAVKKGAVGICMTGEIVNITEIEIRNDE
ncbi:MAG: hypothetical protein M3R27_14725 [Bacteroidota bacterium]|nr:hypothetical protein [Bacteroidota bacterium]